MGTTTTGRTGNVYRMMTNVLLAGLFIFLPFFFRYPEMPRMLFYSFFREVAKAELNFTTRKWPTMEGKRFLVRYRPSDRNIAGLVLKTAEKYYPLVNQGVGYTPRGKILIVIYPNRETLNKSFGWDASESAMGVYWAGVIRVLSPNDWIRDATAGTQALVFRKSGPVPHEYTHLVVDYLTRGNYPRWLTEGVAQYVERDLTGFIFDDPAGNLGQKLYPFKEMDHNFDRLTNQSLAYQQSLAAVDYLVQTYGDHSMRALLVSLGQGRTLDRAFIKTTGQGLAEFEKNFRLWAANQPLAAEIAAIR